MPLFRSSNGLTANEMERLRLLLSVFQDGTGWEARKEGRHKERAGTTLPGWRQFERLIADVFGGFALEAKSIFDVLLPLDKEGTYYGISCKMKGAMAASEAPNGRGYIELSNAAGAIAAAVSEATEGDFQSHPALAGRAILDLVSKWHIDAHTTFGYSVNLEESSHLVLRYSRANRYRLYQFPLELPKADQLKWLFPPAKVKAINYDTAQTAVDNAIASVGPAYKANRLAAFDASGDKVFEWFFRSGGQLKYYPLESTAISKSDYFGLAPLPANQKVGVLSRADEYFHELWELCQENAAEVNQPGAMRTR